MLLSPKSLEKLRILINEDTEYRSGPQLVSLFNKVGFNDIYGQGFPSRWMYTDQKLERINGTPNLIQYIRIVFNPANFISLDKYDFAFSDLDKLESLFNWSVGSFKISSKAFVRVKSSISEIAVMVMFLVAICIFYYK